MRFAHKETSTITVLSSLAVARRHGKRVLLGEKGTNLNSTTNNADRRQGVTCETRAGCSASSKLAGRRGTDESTCGFV